MFSPDGRILVSRSEHWQALTLWDTATGSVLRTIKSERASYFRQSICSVAFSPDGQTLAGGRRDARALLWDVTSGDVRREFPAYGASVLAVAFSPDGQTLAMGMQFSDHACAGGLRLWDIESGDEQMYFGGFENTFNSIAFSPDGLTIASGQEYRGHGDPESITLWDAASGEKLHAFSEYVSTAVVAFSPDGGLLVSGGAYGAIKLWNTTIGGKPHILAAYEEKEDRDDYVVSIAFSPDGRILASGSRCGDIKLWDVWSRQEVFAFKTHSGDLVSVSFSPDGRTLAVEANDETVELWDVAHDLRTWGGPSRRFG